jgi:hypothetical protein
MKWSGREDLVLGRSFDLLVVPINIYKNRYGIVTSERQLEDLLGAWLSYLVEMQVNEEVEQY